MRIPVRVTLAVFAATAALAAPDARAQFIGFGVGYRTPAEVGFLNQRSLLNASQATMGPKQNNVYANDPNAYTNHLHDEGLIERYDVGTRRAIEASVGRFSDGPPPEAYARRPPQSSPSPGASAPRATGPPTLPLSSFFDRYKKLVWPAEAPNTGELAAKRATSDQACLAVLNEYNLRGLANLGTVTDARSKLLAYGRPALQYVRDNETPRIADTYHLFLMALYESLAQAATVPKPDAPAPPPQP